MPEYEDLRIEANDSVYAPAEDSYLAAEFIGEYLNRIRKDKLSIIDVGTGTGILGLSAARSMKVDSAILSDINPDAVELARKNYESNRDMINAKCSFVTANLFSGIRGGFDMVIFNAPYLKREGARKGESWWDGGRDGIEVSLRFLKESMRHLNPGASVFLVYSSLGNEERLVKAIKDLGFRVAESKGKHFFFEDIKVSRLEKE